MSRVYPLLCLFALAASAKDDVEALLRRVRTLVENGRAREALELAERSDLDASPLHRLARAEAARATAGEIQRGEGHGAAVDFLEGYLDHKLTVVAYGETCAWAGEELRGIETLRARRIPIELGLASELHLLSLIGRFDEAVTRATEEGWIEAADWYRAHADLDARLGSRARRGVWVSAVAGALILLGALALFRLARRAETSKERSEA
ncbi:MAG: hypothetical protein ACYSX0_04600 [Planctomycetota bacterium]|jgi:hypothetical protein